MSDGFHIGNVVQLRSGGPQMTIVSGFNQSWRCQWFTESGELRSGEFRADWLRHAPPAGTGGPDAEELRRQLTVAQRNNHLRNLELDALHYVWCNGGCHGGVHRWPCEGRPEITEELVQLAERNTARLRTWFENHKYRTPRPPRKAPDA